VAAKAGSGALGRAVPDDLPVGWTGRCRGRWDLDDAHIFRAAGRPVLIDVFCMAGTALYDAILEDAAGVHRRIPRERMRYALDIPYIARENSAAEILALRKAWARADCDVLTVAGSDLRLVVYTAEPSSPDANRLRLVQVIGLQKLSARDRPT
jgi:hypothetical protein